MKIDLRPGQILMVGDVAIKVVKKSGQLASLVIDADRSIPIRRVEEGESLPAPRQVVVAPA